MTMNDRSLDTVFHLLECTEGKTDSIECLSKAIRTLAEVVKTHLHECAMMGYHDKYVGDIWSQTSKLSSIFEDNSNDVNNTEESFMNFYDDNANVASSESQADSVYPSSPAEKCSLGLKSSYPTLEATPVKLDQAASQDSGQDMYQHLSFQGSQEVGRKKCESQSELELSLIAADLNSLLDGFPTPSRLSPVEQMKLDNTDQQPGNSREYDLLSNEGAVANLTSTLELVEEADGKQDIDSDESTMEYGVNLDANCVESDNGEDLQDGSDDNPTTLQQDGQHVVEIQGAFNLLQVQNIHQESQEKSSEEELTTLQDKFKDSSAMLQNDKELIENESAEQRLQTSDGEISLRDQLQENCNRHNTRFQNNESGVHVERSSKSQGELVVTIQDEFRVSYSINIRSQNEELSGNDGETKFQNIQHDNGGKTNLQDRYQERYNSNDTINSQHNEGLEENENTNNTKSQHALQEKDSEVSDSLRNRENVVSSRESENTVVSQGRGNVMKHNNRDSTLDLSYTHNLENGEQVSEVESLEKNCEADSKSPPCRESTNHEPRQGESPERYSASSPDKELEDNEQSDHPDTDVDNQESDFDNDQWITVDVIVEESDSESDSAQIDISSRPDDSINTQQICKQIIDDVISNFVDDSSSAEIKTVDTDDRVKQKRVQNLPSILYGAELDTHVNLQTTAYTTVDTQENLKATADTTPCKQNVIVIDNVASNSDVDIALADLKTVSCASEDNTIVTKNLPNLGFPPAESTQDNNVIYLDDFVEGVSDSIVEAGITLDSNHTEGTVVKHTDADLILGVNFSTGKVRYISPEEASVQDYVTSQEIVSSETKTVVMELDSQSDSTRNIESSNQINSSEPMSPSNLELCGNLYTEDNIKLHVPIDNDIMDVSSTETTVRIKKKRGRSRRISSKILGKKVLSVNCSTEKVRSSVQDYVTSQESVSSDTQTDVMQLDLHADSAKKSDSATNIESSDQANTSETKSPSNLELCGIQTSNDHDTDQPVSKDNMKLLADHDSMDMSSMETTVCVKKKPGRPRKIRKISTKILGKKGNEVKDKEANKTQRKIQKQRRRRNAKMAKKLRSHKMNLVQREAHPRRAKDTQGIETLMDITINKSKAQKSKDKPVDPVSKTRTKEPKENHWPNKEQECESQLSTGNQTLEIEVDSEICFRATTSLEYLEKKKGKGTKRKIERLQKAVSVDNETESIEQTNVSHSLVGGSVRNDCTNKEDTNSPLRYYDDDGIECSPPPVKQFKLASESFDKYKELRTQLFRKSNWYSYDIPLAQSVDKTSNLTSDIPLLSRHSTQSLGQDTVAPGESVDDEITEVPISVQTRKGKIKTLSISARKSHAKLSPPVIKCKLKSKNKHKYGISKKLQTGTDICKRKRCKQLFGKDEIGLHLKKKAFLEKKHKKKNLKMSKQKQSDALKSQKNTAEILAKTVTKFKTQKIMFDRIVSKNRKEKERKCKKISNLSLQTEFGKESDIPNPETNINVSQTDSMQNSRMVQPNKPGQFTSQIKKLCVILPNNNWVKMLNTNINRESHDRNAAVNVAASDDMLGDEHSKTITGGLDVMSKESNLLLGTEHDGENSEEKTLRSSVKDSCAIVVDKPVARKKPHVVSRLTGRADMKSQIDGDNVNNATSKQKKVVNVNKEMLPVVRLVDIGRKKDLSHSVILK